MTIAQRVLIASWKEHATNISSLDFIGGKAAGLLKLPNLWFPPFIILTKNFYDLWNQKKKSLEIFQSISAEESEDLTKLISDYSKKSNLIYVRSNSPNENITIRGKYQSIAVKNHIEDIAIAVDAIMSSIYPEPMNIILQPVINPGIGGHMSNERRVSNHINRWLIEYSISDKPTQEVIIAKIGDELSNLHASKGDFTDPLRNAAYLLTKIDSGRFHCEWVFDGKVIWIVQVDEVIAEKSETSANCLIETIQGPIPEKKQFQILKHIKDANSNNWKKLRAPLLFDKLNMPVANVYLLTGVEWTNPDNREYILDDLKYAVSEEPIIIRCDISKQIQKDDLLLATSGAISNIDDAINFMQSVVEKFNSQAIAPDNWTFLISYKYSMQASAFVQAFPNSQRIRIDCLWGYPDGLQYYPYDTFYYYPETGSLKKKISYKGLCLLPIEGGWSTYKIEEPLDWESVLNKEEATILGKWALSLANKLGNEVQLMAFARINGKRGVKACIPWHYTELKISPYQRSLKSIPNSPKIKTIESKLDLQTVINEKKMSEISGIVILPKYDDLVRNTSFLEECSKYALENDKLIYFQGSLLGHAYYILTKNGAKVIPIAEDEPKEKKKTYNKLVRDKIPLVIKEAGGIARVRTLSSEESILLLSQKLIEESYEVWNSTAKDLIGELADVLEVVEALAMYSGITLDEIEKTKASKKSKRGGFEELVFLEETEIRPLRHRTNADGTLPLFVNDSDFEEKRTRQQRKIIKFTVGNSSDNINLRIPLVPQVERDLKSPLIEMIQGDKKVRIKYEGNYLHVEVQTIDLNEVNASSIQLTLF